MRKYFMLIFSLMIFLITGGLYIYENTNIPELDYKLPKTSFHSDRFGEIKALCPIFNMGYPEIFILSADKDEKTSYLYGLNLDSNEIVQYNTFLNHSILKDQLLFDDWNDKLTIPCNSGIDTYSIQTPYDKKILCLIVTYIIKILITFIKLIVFITTIISILQVMKIT